MSMFQSQGSVNIMLYGKGILKNVKDIEIGLSWIIWEGLNHSYSLLEGGRTVSGVLAWQKRGIKGGTESHCSPGFGDGGGFGKSFW